MKKLIDNPLPLIEKLPAKFSSPLMGEDKGGGDNTLVFTLRGINKGLLFLLDRKFLPPGPSPSIGKQFSHKLFYLIQKLTNTSFHLDGGVKESCRLI